MNWNHLGRFHVYLVWSGPSGPIFSGALVRLQCETILRLFRLLNLLQEVETAFTIKEEKEGEDKQVVRTSSKHRAMFFIHLGSG